MIQFNFIAMKKFLTLTCLVIISSCSNDSKVNSETHLACICYEEKLRDDLKNCIDGRISLKIEDSDSKKTFTLINANSIITVEDLSDQSDFSKEIIKYSTYDNGIGRSVTLDRIGLFLVENRTYNLSKGMTTSKYNCSVVEGID